MEGALDDNGRGQGPWQCGACTFDNENAHGLACLMCGTERSIASPPIASNGGRNAAASPAAPVLNKPAGENSAPARDAGAERRRSSPAAERGNVLASCSLQCDEESAEAFTQPPGRASADEPQHGSEISAVDNDVNDERDIAGKKGTWDAFASLENNYQSSDESDDDEEEEDHADDDREGSGSEHDDEDRKMGTGAGSGGWDAFKSLEQNYESSEEECDSSSEEEAEFSDGDNEEGGDQSAFNGLQGKKPSPECVDLVDSDEDESDCELEVVAAMPMPGKENNKNDKKRSSERKRSQKYEPYTIDGDSDSSLSEVEGSRPLPSPSARPLPPWQRRRSTPISIGKNGSLKGRDAFSCLTARGDVLGGSRAGVSGVRLAKRKGEETEGATAKRKSRRTTSAAAPKASATDASTTASTAKTKPTRKRRRTTTKAKSAPAKRRRKRTYRKSNKRSARGRSNASASTRGRANNNNNAWSARERGIRNRRGGGESAPYMNIAKQEPMLRNVGGASIQF